MGVGVGGTSHSQGSGRGCRALRQGSRQGADGWRMADRGTKETEGEKSWPEREALRCAHI